MSTDLEEAYGWNSLPGAEREAQKVGDYLSQRLGKSLNILLHNQATETLVKERLHDARFIHLATHGTLASSNESVDLPAVQYSSIPGVLALAASDQDDGSLTADELLEMTIIIHSMQNSSSSAHVKQGKVPSPATASTASPDTC